MGRFPLWSLHEGVRHAFFRLMSDVQMPASVIVDRGEAKGDGYQAESISSYYQEGVGLPSKQTLHC